jgi:hypothetical protein
MSDPEPSSHADRNTEQATSQFLSECFRISYASVVSGPFRFRKVAASTTNMDHSRGIMRAMESDLDKVRYVAVLTVQPILKPRELGHTVCVPNTKRASLRLLKVAGGAKTRGAVRCITVCETRTDSWRLIACNQTYFSPFGIPHVMMQYVGQLGKSKGKVNSFVFSMDVKVKAEACSSSSRSPGYLKTFTTAPVRPT